MRTRWLRAASRDGEEVTTAPDEEEDEEEEEEDEEEEEEEAGGAGGWGAVAKKGMVDPRTTVNNKEYRIEKAVDFIKKSFKYEHDDAVVAMTHAFFLAEGEYSFIFKGIPHDENGDFSLVFFCAAYVHTL